MDVTKILVELILVIFRNSELTSGHHVVGHRISSYYAENRLLSFIWVSGDARLPSC